MQLNIILWKIICLICGERCEEIIVSYSCTHNFAVVRLKPQKKKNSDLNWIITHDLCYTGAVLHYQLSYQANWELATLRERDIYTPVEGEEYK